MLNAAVISKYVCKVYGKSTITFGDILLTLLMLIMCVAALASLFMSLLIMGGAAAIAISAISSQNLFGITYISTNPFNYSLYQFIGLEILGFIVVAILAPISFGFGVISTKVFGVKILQCPDAPK